VRILLVEDDPTTSKSIEMMLQNANLNVYATDLGEEGIDLAKLYDYDLILLDLNLPDMNGHEVLRQLRVAKVETPILILSGMDDTESKLKGFGFGADDYMTKPFNRQELIARIHAIVRRSKGHAQSVIATGKFTVNLDTKTVEVDDKPVHLTGKEYQMLELLSLRKGTTLTKEMFLNHLYGGMDEPELKIIDVFICKLRKKLSEATGGENYIETVWGRGYVLRDPASSSESKKRWRSGRKAPRDAAARAGVRPPTSDGEPPRDRAGTKAARSVLHSARSTFRTALARKRG
jgi:two-component system, cell cycle response regulator CtrA